MAPLSDTELESSSSSDGDELLFRPAFPARPPAAATATTKCTGANVNDDCNGKQSQEAGAAAAAGAAGRIGRRRLVIDDDSSSGGSSGDDSSSSSSSSGSSCDISRDDDESSYCNDHPETADDDASQTSQAQSLQLGTPHILHKFAPPPATAAPSPAPATAASGFAGSSSRDADGLVSALEDLALSPVGVVSTPMVGIGGGGGGGNGRGAAPSASARVAAGNAGPNVRTTPARRSDGMRCGDDDDEEEETESDAEDGTSIFQTSRCDDDEEEEVDTEEEDTKSNDDDDDDDDIFQTSYYVRTDHPTKVGDGTDDEDIMTMTRPREPARLCLMDTDDEEGGEGKSLDAISSRCSSSSSSSGFTISDDEEGCDEIGSLFREGLKISSPTSRLDGTDDDDDNHNSRLSATSPSNEPPALVLSPLEPSPERVDMTSDDDEVVHVSSRNADEPTDSAWKHDSATDEYYLSGSGGGERVQWPNLRVPAALYRRLFPHQRVGVQWIGSLHTGGVGGILGDDMGLGKVGDLVFSILIFHFFPYRNVL